MPSLARFPSTLVKLLAGVESNPALKLVIALVFAILPTTEGSDVMPSLAVPPGPDVSSARAALISARRLKPPAGQSP